MRISMQSNNSLEYILACPVCKGPIAENGFKYECTTCEKSYPVKDGILSLATKSTALGEFSIDEMQVVLRAAEDLGWRTALETHVKPQNPSVLDLILDNRRSRFLEILQSSQNGVAVDIGCGYGGICLQLAQHYRQVFALDSGLERLGFLNVIRKQEHIHNIRAIHHENITSLPFADNSVDIIILVGVFEYLPLAFPEYSIQDVQHRILGEFHRVLKAGGHLYIGTKNRFGWPYWKGGADHNRLRFGPILPRGFANRLTQYFYRKPYRIIVDSLPSYRELLQDAGFNNSRFYWPIPGYQFPDTFVSLDSDAAPIYRFADRSSSGRWKKFVISTLQALGILKYVVPHFSIVAKKD